MSDDQSELGIVLAHAPRLKNTFGRRWAALITIVSLYFARRRLSVVGIIAWLAMVIGFAIQRFG